MNIELFIANRYLRSKQRTGFISLITYISAAGVMIGTAALVIVLSVMNGFESEVRGRIIGADSHIKVSLFHDLPMNNYQTTADTISRLREVIGITPYIQDKGLLRRGKSVEWALVKGIDETTVGAVSDLPKTIVAGSLDVEGPVETIETVEEILGKSPRPKTDKPTVPGSITGIILGRQLSFRLGASIGDTVLLISPAGMTSLFSSPRLKRFIVTGVFETGIYEYDDSFSYISLGSAADLYELGGGVTGLEVKLRNPQDAEQVSRFLEDKLGYPYYPRTWQDMHKTLFRWMKIEKWMYTILLSLIILVAAFNIVASQIMVVIEKRREIGILKAIGATRERIMRIFMYEGMIVGIVGTVAGLALGWSLCRLQQVYQFFSLPGDVYFLNSLPVRMQIFDFVIIGFVSIGLTLLATIYPARRAGQLDPVEAIRYE